MKKKLLALASAMILLITGVIPQAVADFLPTLPPDASVTAAPETTPAPEADAAPETPAPSASVTVTTETVESTSSLRSGLEVWIGMNGSLYVKNVTRNYMKYVQVFFSAGGEFQAMDDVFSLSSGQTKKIRTPEEIQEYMTEHDLSSLQFLALQSATKGEEDYVATSEICVFAPETVIAIIDKMPVYRSDNTSSGRLYSVSEGTKLLMLNSRDDWARVYTEDGIGYTRIKYLALENGLASIVTEDTFVYEEATMNSKRTEIAEGTVVYLVGKSGKFFLIRDLSGEYAYILKTDLAEYEGEIPETTHGALIADPAESEPVSTESDSPAEPESSAAAEPAVSEVPGFHYQDSSLSLSIHISEGDWIYQKDDASNQVYFQETGCSPDDRLSISSQALPQGAQFASLHQQSWAAISASLTANSIAISELVEEDRLLGSDGQFPCHVYQMTLTTSGVNFKCAYAFWSTGDKLYVCTLSATEENSGKMFAALDEILSSFEPAA